MFPDGQDGKTTFSLPEKAREIWDSKIIQPPRIATLSRDILF
jgi:hypothetical protein